MNAEQDQILNTQMYAFPAVPLQERIWMLNATGDANPAWNVAVRFRLIGALSISRFQQALNNVVARTEILRTSFAMIDGEVKQIVSKSLAVPIHFVDCSASTNFEADLDHISRQEAELPLLIQNAPLLRVVLIRSDLQTHYLLITAHHAIVDGVSIGLLSDALLSAYEKVDDLNTQSTNELDLQFADYALWLKEQRQSPAYLSHAAYWERSLEGLSALEPVTQSRNAHTHIESLLLPRLLTNAAQQLCQKLDVTFSQLALAVFACAANKLNAVIGMPVASRPEVQLETMIGPFVNYLPIRIKVEKSDNFEDMLTDLAEISREALEHSEFRYEDILTAKGLSNQSLFDTVFICQRDFVHARTTNSLELTAIPSVSPGALQDLTLFLVERSDGWRLSCEISDRYTPATAKDLLHRYQHIMQVVCKDPEVSLASFTEYSERIEEATASPVREQSFELSATQQRYWALNRIDPDNNRLNLHIRYAVEGVFDKAVFKQALQALAIRHDVLRSFFVEQNGDVRFHISPTIDLPFHHHNDSQALLDTTSIVDLLDQEKQLSFNLQQGPLWSVLVITSGDRSFFSLTLSHIISDGWSCGILIRELLANYDAIVSGKASNLAANPGSFSEVAIHAASINQNLDERLAYWNETLGESSPHLDLPTDAVQGDLASVVIETRSIDPMLSATITQMARDYGVTVANIYAAAYRALLFKYTGFSNLLVATPIANRPPGSEGIVGPFADSLLLRSSIGETFETALQATQNSLLSAVEYIIPLQHLMERLRRNSAESGAAIPIGFMYQEAFVRDLIGDHLSLRAMENHLADFSFDWHMAVIDHGSAVNLEFTATHTGMSQELAALIVQDFEQSLSGYVLAPRKQLVKVAGATPRIRRICDPAKAERQLLELAPKSISPTGGPVASPEKTAEMVRIWQEVFGRIQISGSDNFFALGGHSLLLARLQVALEKEFGYRIYAADIFAAPTCELLAYRMSSGVRSTSSQLARIIPLQSEGKGTPLFVISQSMIVRELAEHLAPNQATFTIQFIQEDVDRLGKHATMQQIAALYIEHMRATRPSGPYRLGGWCVSGWVAYEMAQQLRSAGEDVELLIIFDAWAPNFWRDMRGLKRILGRGSYYAHRLYYETWQTFTRENAGTGLWSRSAPLRESIQSTLSSIVGRVLGRFQPPTTPETPLDEMMDAAAESYRPEPYADERSLVFRSAEQPTGGFLPRHMGWHGYLKPEVEIIPLPGDHTGMFSGLGATTMAECIKYKLDQGYLKNPDVAVNKARPVAKFLKEPLCL